jgi:two-component system response regulator YesN
MEMQSSLNEKVLPCKVREALQYIKKNYNRKNLHLKEIASHVNMREDSFSHLWHHTMKISISEFINGLRLNTAEALLCNGFSYISQIAYKLGFTPAYFSKLFKRKFGISPKAYREQFTKQEQNITRNIKILQGMSKYYKK